MLREKLRCLQVRKTLPPYTSNSDADYGPEAITPATTYNLNKLQASELTRAMSDQDPSLNSLCQ